MAQDAWHRCNYNWGHAIEMKISIYDFDGTIYTKDSSIEYAIYCLKLQPWRILYALVFITIFLLYKLSLVSKETAKSWLFRIMIDDQKKISGFWSTNILYFVPSTLDAMKEDIEKGYKIVIITSSPRFLVSGALLLIEREAELIATETMKGKPYIFTSKNCFGKEKVNRFNEWVKASNLLFEKVEIERVVSDSSEDEPLYNLGGCSYYLDKGCLRIGRPKKR